MQKKRTFKAAFTCRWAPSDGKDGKDGLNGQNGKDGVGIKTADVVFKLSSSNTEQPDNAGWVTLFSQLQLKEQTYVWSCTKIELTNGNTTYTGKQCLGSSKDFVTITEQYAIGNSGTTAPTSGWGTNYTPTKELWLWTRNRMRWTNGSYTYTTAICIGYFGKDGETPATTKFYFGWSSHSELQSDEAPSDIVDWSENTPPPEDGKPYLWMCIEPPTGASTYARVTGEDGAPGASGAYTSYSFNISKQRTSKNASTTPSDCAYSAWNDAPIQTTETYPYLWMRMERKNDQKDNSVSYVCMTGAKGDPGQPGTPGTPGTPGIPGLIERTSEWATGVEFHNDENLTGGIRYIDLVTVTDNTTGKFEIYQCRVTHTSTAANAPSDKSAEWLKLNQMRPIYTPLIVAKNAVLRFSQTNRILITNSKDKVQGCFGGVEDETNGYPLWIGAITAADAKFKVKYGGQLVASEASITGTINATSGTFNNVTINSGKIAGFTIEGTSLTNSPWKNDASIIFRNDNKSCFAGIGGNILPASTGLRAVARFENEDKTNQWGLGSNYAMILSAKNGRYNYAFYGAGSGILNGSIVGYAFETIEANKANTCFGISPTKALKYIAIMSNKSATIGLPSLTSLCSFLGIKKGSEFCVELGIGIELSGSSYTMIYGKTDQVNNMNTDEFPTVSWNQKITYTTTQTSYAYNYFTGGYNVIALTYRNGKYTASLLSNSLETKK